MRWNPVKKTCLWHVFRDLPAGACAKGESARRARESCWPSHNRERNRLRAVFCRSASVCPDFGAYAIHPWRGSFHRDDQPIAKNKNNKLFATFLRLGTPLRSLKAEKSRNIAILLRFRALICDRGNSRRSLIAKKLQLGAIFCFWAHGPASGRCWGGWGTRPLARLQAYALV